MYMSAIGRVIGDRMEYEKLPDGRWRATFAGQVSATADARSPEEARRMVECDLDTQLAAWVAPVPTKPVAAPGSRQRAAGRKSNVAARNRRQ